MKQTIITNGAELKLASVLREINAKYNSLNDGGCVHVAKWIGEAFIKRGCSVKYLILDTVDSAELREVFRKRANLISLEDLSEEMIDVSHVLTVINNRLYVDSKGVYTSFESTSWRSLYKMGYITHSTLVRWTKDKYYRWNPAFMYQHGHEMPKIEREIKRLIKSLHI